jgi:protein-S-isoprenylcysteine O-methyltransferase Ste14
MTQNYTVTANEVDDQADASLLKRSIVLGYGLTGYLVGVTALTWFILAMGGLAPSAFSPLKATSVTGALIVNIGLVFLFGLQHSIMARKGFKKKMSAIMPRATERSTFLFATGIVLMLAIWAWQPLPGTVWSVENTIATIGLWSLYGIGWTYLLLATFITNHFELMGLRQAYLYFTKKEYKKVPFTRKFMYRYSRHPMMLGVLLGMWCVPEMSVTHFIMASLFSVYIFTGIFFEERDLETDFGETYKNYKNEIAALMPKIY